MKVDDINDTFLTKANCVKLYLQLGYLGLHIIHTDGLSYFF